MKDRGMKGQMDEMTDGWKDRLMEGQMNKRTNR